MKLTKKEFFDSLKWHDGKPPYFEEPSNSQIPFHGTIYDQKVVAIKDDLDNAYIIGTFNNNFCMDMCKGCLDHYDPNEHPIVQVPCITKEEIVEWAEFYDGDENQ